MEEVWKEWPIEDHYKNILEISSNGEVRNKKTKKLRKLYVNKAGYLWVGTKYGLFTHPTIHRLVALAFIPNPYNLPCVNHIDENKLNNKVDNLEWCTYKYNSNYGNRNLKIKQYHKNNTYKRVGCYDLDGNLIKIYNSVSEVEKDGFCRQSVKDICRNRDNHKTHPRGKYMWKYI